MGKDTGDVGTDEEGEGVSVPRPCIELHGTSLKKFSCPQAIPPVGIPETPGPVDPTDDEKLHTGRGRGLVVPGTMVGPRTHQNPSA